MCNAGTTCDALCARPLFLVTGAPMWACSFSTTAGVRRVTERLSWSAQRFLQEHGEVQLSALGIAISSMVTVAEILKNKQLAEESRITTSLEWLSAESRRASGCPLPHALSAHFRSAA